MNRHDGSIQNYSPCGAIPASGEFLLSEPAPAGGSIVKELIKPAFLLGIAAFCLFEFMLQRRIEIFQDMQLALLQTRWMLLICLAVWCGTFLFLTFSFNDLALAGLLFIAGVAYFIVETTAYAGTGALVLLFGMTLGKGAGFLLKAESGKYESENLPEMGNRKSQIGNFLIGLVVLLAFASWWHLDMTNNFYHGPRWMGLWNNPNDYGQLMGAGVTLAVGLLAAREHSERKETFDFSPRPFSRLARRGSSLLRSGRSFTAIFYSIVLFLAAGMMGVGLVMSYSRGAWTGTVVGLLYLARAYGKFKWRYVLPVLLAAAGVVWFFWNTPRTAPWYEQRLDLSRGSVQHRLAAWRAGLEMMRDHPFGVGWNKTVETYEKHYSPPAGGAAAIMTNDYVMLGTQLGWAGLLCFLAYVALCFRGGVRHFGCRKNGGRGVAVECAGESALGNDATCHVEKSGVMPPQFKLSVACRAGALVMLVAFGFDGGLFKLATASVFWILLELGSWDRGVDRWKAKAIKEGGGSSGPS